MWQYVQYANHGSCTFLLINVKCVSCAQFRILLILLLFNTEKYQLNSCFFFTAQLHWHDLTVIFPTLTYFVTILGPKLHNNHRKQTPVHLIPLLHYYISGFTSFSNVKQKLGMSLKSALPSEVDSSALDYLFYVTALWKRHVIIDSGGLKKKTLKSAHKIPIRCVLQIVQHNIIVKTH